MKTTETTVGYVTSKTNATSTASEWNNPSAGYHAQAIKVEGGWQCRLVINDCTANNHIPQKNLIDLSSLFINTLGDISTALFTKVQLSAKIRRTMFTEVSRFPLNFKHCKIEHISNLAASPLRVHGARRLPYIVNVHGVECGFRDYDLAVTLSDTLAHFWGIEKESKDFYSQIFISSK